MISRWELPESGRRRIGRIVQGAVPTGVLVICWLALLAGPAARGAESKWQSERGYRWSELSAPPAGKNGFKALSGSETGITFTNLLADEHSLTNRNLLSGSGVAAGDV